MDQLTNLVCDGELENGALTYLKLSENKPRVNEKRKGRQPPLGIICLTKGERPNPAKMSFSN
ncbi:hypothetical protein A9Q81_23085 [Gammaproteobacteria bacterium 42_54_T18]|nr:hypothetical protein A9Q81_23085 [Gammaproteobacteria bacterium 42_54_T18]